MSANPVIMQPASTPFDPLGYLVYKRSYARTLEDGSTEEFSQTIDRVLSACKTQLGINFDADEEALARGLFLNLKCSVAGRFLWQLGTKTVDLLGFMSLQNCAVTTVNEPVRPFTWAFDALLLGSGVGFNVQSEYVHEIPRIKSAHIVREDTKDADYIIPDKREGWVRLLEKVMESHFITGKGFTYSTICLRGKGTPIKGFGGVASGPEELCKGIGYISSLLNEKTGKKLRPVDALDIANILGAIVVSGDIRKSAQILIGDPNDISFLNAKRWDKGSIPTWRAMSNNSVACSDIDELPRQFWEGYYGNGEPYGLVNLRLAREVGRLGETKYPDPDVVAVNPCAESTLNDKETCCLGEIFLPNIVSYEELLQCLKLVYKICKHSLTLHCHLTETQDIVNKNMRMGIGVTGYMQASDEQRSWLSNAYLWLRAFDKAYSDSKGWPISIKLTSVKPSGTLSLLPGVTPGIHPGYAQHFIRRVRVLSSSPIVDLCRKNGYQIEPQMNQDGSLDHSTMVISFPCKYPKGTILASDTTAIKQLEWVKKLQTEWADNAVSCTVYYKVEELPEIKEWLRANYANSLKSISFLLHTGHNFKQAPYEEISEHEFRSMKNRTRPLHSLTVGDNEVKDSMECEGASCPMGGRS